MIVVTARYGARVIDVAAIAAMPGADAEAEFVRHDRSAEGGTGLVTRVALVGVAGVDAGISAVLSETGFGRDEADRATLGARSEQGSLRPAQDFDPVEIEHLGEGGADQPYDADPDLHGDVVEVDGRRRSAAARIDAANGQQVLRTRHLIVDAGRSLRHVGKVRDAQLVEGCRVEDRDTDRHSLDILHTLLGRDNDFLQRGGSVLDIRAVGVGCPQEDAGSERARYRLHVLHSPRTCPSTHRA